MKKVTIQVIYKGECFNSSEMEITDKEFNDLKNRQFYNNSLSFEVDKIDCLGMVVSKGVQYFPAEIISQSIITVLEILE